MRRLLDDFAAVFDLDYRVEGLRLADLIGETLTALDSDARPDWGTPGPRDALEAESDRSVRFQYRPHLFPGMDLKLRLAHKLQFHLLPRDAPQDSPVSIAAVLESYCHLSGDLFGWEMLPDGRFFLWILDLSGHGVQTGLASAVLKVMIDRAPRRGRLDELVCGLNDSLAACVREPFRSLFATGFFTVLDRDGSADYVSAGHPPVLVRSRDRSLRELPSSSLPIGMFSDRAYPVTNVRIAPGETLLLYTDGVVEAADGRGEPFGLDRLRDLLRSDFDLPEILTSRVYRTLARHQDMDKLSDDVTLVAATLQSAW